MKFVKSKSLTIIFVFGLSLIAMLLYINLSSATVQRSEISLESDINHKKNSPLDLEIVDYCVLANNPVEYDGKIVRLRGKITSGLEGAWLSDAECSGGIDNAAVVSSKSKEVWQVIEQSEDSKHPNITTNLVFIGRFKNTIYEKRGLKTPFQFEIINFEKTSNANLKLEN